MIVEIESYITRHYHELLSITNKITKNSDWSGDLLNDVICQLYDKKEIKLKSLDDNSIKYYIIAIIKINWISKTSPFYRKVRRESTLYSELTSAREMIEEDNIFESHLLMDLMEENWAELDWFRKNIFERYMIMGSLKKVAIDTTIPLTSIARYVNSAKQEIKLNIISKLKDE